MAGTLPELTVEAFSRALARTSPGKLSEAAEWRLFAHYQLLRKWNPRLSLIGPGTTDEVMARHYGESLAALGSIQDGETVLDIGTGAGFPGLVLALARPKVHFVLVEAQERKWSFLLAALRAAWAENQRLDEASCPFSIQVLNARIGRPLPAAIPSKIDIVTSRAVRLVPDLLEPLVEHCRPIRLLLWQGEGSDLPHSLSVRKRRKLAGGERRYLIEAVVADQPSVDGIARRP